MSYICIVYSAKGSSTLADADNEYDDDCGSVLWNHKAPLLVNNENDNGAVLYYVIRFLLCTRYIDKTGQYS